MDQNTEVPAALQKAQQALEPYIKERQETSRIRQILSSHLVSQCKPTGHNLNRPLSLIDSTYDVNTATRGQKGLQREYLRCVLANVKARNEYKITSTEHRQDPSAREKQNQGQLDTSKASDHLSGFVHLNMQRRKHERLRISQDYIDVLAQKPAASVDHLDPSIALKDIDSAPKVPPEVLHNHSATSTAGGTDLKSLVDHLEKSAFRAKMLLKKEQKLLEDVRKRNNVTSPSRQNRLQALGLTRNALINWIEAEMERAGEEPTENDDGADSQHDSRGQEFIDAQLASIQRQYSRYIEARKALINSVASSSESQPSQAEEESLDYLDVIDELPQEGGMHLVLPYIESMASIASEQKAVIQHRSHLTISLAKQVKEACQGLDRLADESHLLPAYPMPTVVSQRKGLDGPLSFNDELTHLEKPDSSARAQAWVYAAKSSSATTKDAVLEQVDNGNEGLNDSRQSMSAIQKLLGYGNHGAGETESKKQDIWAVLDGNLGVLNGE